MKASCSPHKSHFSEIVPLPIYLWVYYKSLSVSTAVSTQELVNEVKNATFAACVQQDHCTKNVISRCTTHVESSNSKGIISEH